MTDHFQKITLQMSRMICIITAVDSGWMFEKVLLSVSQNLGVFVSVTELCFNAKTEKKKNKCVKYLHSVFSRLEDGHV